MGSINVIWNPKYWKFCFEGRSKLIDEDIIPPVQDPTEEQ